MQLNYNFQLYGYFALLDKYVKTETLSFLCFFACSLPGPIAIHIIIIGHFYLVFYKLYLY